jgi:hypothetical protein
MRVHATVNLYIGNTDNDWLDFLAAQPDLTEVNFGSPVTRPFIHYMCISLVR